MSDAGDVHCPACRAALGDETCRASAWDRSPSGDEYADEIHRCGGCGAWWVVTRVDRFCGPEEMKIDGPLTAEEAQQRCTAMRERQAH